MPIDPNDLRELSREQLALLVTELAEQLESNSPPPSSNNDIAIIGMAGRIAGAENISQYWAALENGDSLITQFSTIGTGDTQDPTGASDTKFVPVWGVTKDVELFDADFFHISQAEAALLDPQQRIFLQCAWNALEDAGHPPSATQPFRIGVFAGAGFNSYLISHVWGEGIPDTPNAQYRAFISNDKDFLATRTAYLLNLRGPALTIQTACSTSLVSVHLACQSLLRGECEIAIAGGVGVRTPRPQGYLYEQGMILSPDGVCRPFDADADGTIPGEGVGIVVLRKLETAVRERDQIYAVIKGTAINNDGSMKTGYTAPSVDGQINVIQAALAAALVEPETVHYIETHGTGTKLGDPIEFAALKEAYRADQRPSKQCVLGAVKASIGHLDTAAGIAGLIKTALVVKNGIIPPTLHFNTPNPHLDFGSTCFEIANSRRKWSSTEDQPRRAGVSAFGIGGTNAHAILEEFRPEKKEIDFVSDDKTVQLLCISAKTQWSLNQLETRYKEFFKDASVSLEDICFTANTCRQHFPERRCLVGSSVRAIADQLRIIESHEINSPNPLSNKAKQKKQKICFVFGSSRAAIADIQNLLNASSTAREILNAIDPTIRVVLGRSLATFLDQGASSDQDNEATISFIYIYLVASALQKWGIKPDILVGSGLGEIAAATLGGTLSVEDALKLTLQLRRSEMQNHIQWNNRSLLRSLQSFNYADARTFRTVTQTIATSAPKIRWASTATGEVIQGLVGDIHWTKVFESPAVLNAEVLEREHVDVFVQIDGNGILGILRQQLRSSHIKWISTRTNSSSEYQTLLEAVAQLYQAGCDINWAEFYDRQLRQRVSIPTYAFERHRYWIEGKKTESAPAVKNNWTYEIHWRESQFKQERRSPAGRTWILLGQQSELSDYLATTLQKNGDQFVSVELDNLTAQLQRLSGHHLGVIYCMGADAKQKSDLSADSIINAVQQHCDGLLKAIQIMVRVGIPGSRLWLVTQHAQIVDGTDTFISLNGAASWGLARTLAHEHAEFFSQMIDIDDTSALGRSMFLQEMMSDNSETEVAYRRGKRYVPRLVSKSINADSRKLCCTDQGSYLVTGGLGGLGLEIAKWLVRCGAKKLVLVSRTGLTTSLQRTTIESLLQQGIHVEVANGDISHESFASQLIADLRQRKLGPIRGVIHAAGILDDAVTMQLTTESMHRVFLPKVKGTWALLNAVKNEPLEFFVTFSSLGAVFGGPGQGNYSAANAFMDALMQDRSRRGLIGLSINWGSWGGVGMAARLDPLQKRRIEASGMKLMDPLSGTEQLGNLLKHSIKGQIIVADIDWRRVSKDSQGRNRVASELIDSSTSEENISKIKSKEVTKKLSVKQQRENIAETVGTVIAGILGMDPASIAEEQPLMELGIDSLLAVEARNRLSKAFDSSVRLPASLTIDYPTIRALTEYFLRNLSNVVETSEALLVEHSSLSAIGQDEIAIVGIGCRFPGGANTPDDYWHTLVNGQDSVIEVPDTRWDADLFYDRDPKVTDKMRSKEAAFLRNVDISGFDAKFFGISDAEATLLDPQQRLVLEVSWEALENAGESVERLAGSRTGVFLGLYYHDYARIIEEHGQFFKSAYASTGNTASVAAGRLSYLWGFQGPSMVVDTACSSSLVTVHLACQSLRRGETNLALAGGVVLMMHPGSSILLSTLQVVSGDGRCKTFDTRADGMGRGEGAGIVVLKRLKDAIRDKNLVLGVIKATSVNQDGRSTSLTAPNGPAQQTLLRDALNYANASPQTVDYLEAHGTGTALGDPIELTAAGNVLGYSRNSSERFAVGSTKTNIGHLEPAAGIAGLIKLVLSLRNEILPPHLHLKEMSPYLDLDQAMGVIASSDIQWPHSEKRRTCGVSAFGVSGTNAHVLIEEPAETASNLSELNQSSVPLCLSAKSNAALKEQAKRWANWISETNVSLDDACFTAATGRNHFSERAIVLPAERDELVLRLNSISRGESHPQTYRRRINDKVKLGLVFGGSHAHAAFQENAEIIGRAHSILGNAWPTDESSVAILSNFTKSWNLWEGIQRATVEVDTVLGFRDGEIAAACAAGVMSWEDGLCLCAKYCAVLRDGRLVDVGLLGATEQQVHQCFQKNDVRVLGILSENRILIGGDLAQIESVSNHNQFLWKPLTNKMRLAEELICDVSPTDRYQSPQFRWMSGTTGKFIDDVDSTYWNEVFRNPVKWMHCFQSLLDSGIQVVAELMGNHSVLGLGRYRTDRDDVVWLATSQNDEPFINTLGDFLGQFYVAGIHIDWNSVYMDKNVRKTALPAYPFERAPYWVESSARDEKHFQQASQPMKPSKSIAVQSLPLKKRPLTFTEGQIAIVWKDVLNLEVIDVEQHLDVGQHLLDLSRLRHKIVERLKIDLLIEDIVAHSSVRTLALFIDEFRA